MTGAEEVCSTSGPASAKAAILEATTILGRRTDKHTTSLRHSAAHLSEETAAGWLDHSALIIWPEPACAVGSRGGRIPFRVPHTFCNRDRNMPPHLNRQNHSGRQQQRSHRNVGHGGSYHGKLGLCRVPAPRHASDEGSEAQAKLRDQKRAHQNRGR